MKFWYLILLGLASALLLFVTLNWQSQVSNTTQISIEGPIEIILKSNELNPMDFWDVAQRGIREASREFGVEVNFSGPRHESEVEQQIRILTNIIAQNPPAIILAAGDYELLAVPLELTLKNKIPVITFDSAVNSDIPLSFIATDNTAAGEKAGIELKRLMETSERRQIAIVSHIQGTATAIEREKGVRNALHDENIIGTWFCDVNEDKAFEITLELLKNPQLGGIVALNEAASLGVARAIDEANRESSVIAVGFDNAERELSYLERGILRATVVQRPYNMGYMAVKTAVEQLSGKNVESFIDTGSILITAENMFQKEYQELLFPFPEP